MPPQGTQTDLFNADLIESDVSKSNVNDPKPSSEMEMVKWKIVWHNVVVFTLLHIGAVYGAYLLLTGQIMLKTLAFAIFYYICSGIGVTGGAHRFWSHGTYKAKLPLKILLVIFFTISGQQSILTWARDHRLHHKHSGTDSDPQNANRGFFFAHIGWLFVKKHPKIKQMAHTIDMSDLCSDPLLRFQKKYYVILMPLLSFILPTYIPTLWGESAWNSFFTAGVLRFIGVMQGTWLVNSVAHLKGMRPYDKHIGAVESKTVSAITLGEGFHNYHHTFPWDYKTAELGDYSLNVTKLFIDFMAKIGWAYDLKTASPDLILNKINRSGDGSHRECASKSKLPEKDI